jgi:hypothetical protein
VAVGIHVDTNQDADVRNFFETGPNGKVAGSAQKADQGVKPFDVRVALKDTLKLFEQRLFAVISEKARGHASITKFRNVWSAFLTVSHTHADSTAS